MFASTQPFASQAATQEDKKPRAEEKQTVLPTTVRAIQTAAAGRKDDSELEMFGSTPSLLVLVGVVESPDIQTSSAQFMLNDSTGRLSVRCFAGEGVAESLETSVKAGAYVMATGHVRFSPELQFSAIQLRSVTSGDEIAYHMIESAHAALKLRAAPSPVEAAPAVKAPEAASVMPAAPTASMATTGSPVSAAPGLSSEKVLAYLTSVSEERPEGVSRAGVQEHFSGSTESEVRKALDEIVASGDAFTTVDDDHFSAV